MKPKQTKYTKSPSAQGQQKSSTRRGNYGKEIRAASSAGFNQANSYIDELKNDVAAFFEINNTGQWSTMDVVENFDADDRKLKLMVQGLIGELHDEGRLTRLPDGRFQFNQNQNTILGKVEHVNSKFAFIVPQNGNRDRDNDIWIPAEDLGGAIDGDMVRVIAFSDSRQRGTRQMAKRIVGRVVSIAERGKPEIVGTLERHGKDFIVAPDSRRIYHDILIPADKLGGANENEKVIVRLTKYPESDDRDGYFEGEVISVLGVAGDHNTEMHAILAEFGLPIEFPAEVEKESEEIPVEIDEAEFARRRDFRTTTTFTIDPVDAKDFDDALSVKYLDNGIYEIGIHIADVTHYVTPGTELEEEAYKRATSVYLVDRVVPMLPEKLSNGVCSLRPNEDKLTFSAVFEMNDEGKISKEWFGRTAIHSDRRFSYEEAQDILNAGQGDFVKELTLLNGLAHKLRDERFQHGAINFETPEVRFKLDENGVPLAVIPKIRQDTNKLIEEFMLLANKRVAEFVMRLSKGDEANTMVYRVHEGPDEDRLRVFSEFARRLGYKLNVDDTHLSRSMNKFMEQIEGKPEQGMLSQLAVRTMSKARYSTEDLGHFGLAFARYSHFTSPIRRYPDMMAHRLLQHYLDKGRSVDREALEARCKHASDREKVAAEAERASIKYKQVEFMSRMPKDMEFAGVIAGVTEFGFFVEIPENSCEGLVRMQDLTDDFYEYDKDNYRIIGRKSKKMYTFGDAVTVRVKEANLARRSIDFALITDNAKTAEDGWEGGERTSSGRSGGSRSRRSDSPIDQSQRNAARGRKAANTSTSATAGGRSKAVGSEVKRTKGASPKGQNRRGGRGK
ncbi:ribonuclease R [uncultured Fibrella sp.]|uniref:ribonuclease R n=1 Tax=uncultured Fibrella sp. TaxID=1284596 RepID=UPI0035CA64B1